MIIPFPTPEPVPLFLDKVPPELQAAARACFEAGDGRGFAEKAAAGDGLNFVHLNVDPLTKTGIYEAALLAAFVRDGANHCFSRPKDIAYAFFLADHTKLLAAGDELPPLTAFNVFRGVAGRDRWRREDGFSWTLDRDVACWYALRDGVEDPAVISATVQRSDVLAYYDGRGEREIITYPGDAHPHRRETGRLQLTELLTLAELQEGAQRWELKRKPAGQF